MSYKSIANLKDSVSAQLQGLNLNNVKNLYGAFERTARQLTSIIEVKETEGRQNVTLYNGVYDYSAPSDIFGRTLIDFQPQGSTRGMNDYTYKLPISNFDRMKSWNPNGARITFEYRNGTPIMRIVSARPIQKIELDSMTETTGWVASGSAGTIYQDETVLYQNPASLRFNLTGASTGILTKTIPSQDLTDYLGVGVVFIAIRTPSSTNLSSISIKIGSDASNYYSVSATSGFIGAWNANEWTIVALDLSSATTTGSPTITVIDYIQISFAHLATFTNFYVGGLWISLPSPHTLIYSTSAFFLTSGGSPSQTIVNNNDTINLSDDAFAIYEIMCAITIANQQGGTLAGGVVQSLNQKLLGDRGYRGTLIQPGLIDIYRANNPSEQLRTIQNYYDD